MRHFSLKHQCGVLAALGVLLVTAAPAQAKDFSGGMGDKPHHFKDMSSEEREKFRAERKAKWDALSDSEKVKLIETRRAERRKAMDEKWGKMSDAEKVKFVEDRMKRRHKRHDGDGAGDPGGDMPPPPPPGEEGPGGDMPPPPPPGEAE